MAETGMARVMSAETHRLNKAVEQLMGIVTGVVADGELTDKEVLFLRTWLIEHDAVAEHWPGSAIYRVVSEVLHDGVITDDERAHLLGTLKELVQSDFSNTGSSLSEGPTLPVNDKVTVQLTNISVCHTGAFLYGTRAAVERATLKAGGLPMDGITKKTDLVVIGSKLSPDWAHTTFGRKIQKARELQDAGEAIEIISERRWLQALG